jgi:ABC-type transport system involved in multi-copper enzyme maturation permease subunit
LNAATEIGLLVTRELRRSVRSLKGVILGIITLVGAVIASVALVWIQGAAVEEAGSQEAFDQVNRKLLEQGTGDAALAAQLARMPDSLRNFLDITVWLAPLLIALLGFDGIAGELQHKAVRFWTVRARRGSYFAGKLLGLWALVGLVILVLNVIVGTVAVAKGYVSLVDLLKWGSRFWLVAFVIAGAWAAIATLISSLTKQPIAALLTTFGVFFLLWLSNLIGEALRRAEMIRSFRAAMAASPDAAGMPVMPPMRWYQYAYPNAYEHMLLSSDATKVLTAFAVLLAFVVVAIAGGAFLFSRRDI